MPITKEQFASVAAANPGVEIEVLQHPTLPDEVIARVPAPGVWNVYRKKQEADDMIGARQHLVSHCILFPDAVELQKSLDAHPALVEVWAGELTTMAGFSQGARRKKF